MENKYAVGQCWSYDTRPGFESSRIVIGAIEENADVGEVICVTLIDVPLMLHKGEEAGPATIDFVPFSRQAIDSSVRSLLGNEPPSAEFAGHHENWKEETEGDDYLTIPVTVFLDILAAADSD